MIDNMLDAMLLVDAMNRTLPLMASASPELAAVMRKQSPGCELPRKWQVTEVYYADDPGGIMCRLDAGSDSDFGSFVVSITHLLFDRAQPLVGDIARYQKRRLKGLRKIGVPKMRLLQEKGRQQE